MIQEQTLLYRHIAPDQIQNGRVTSQAFKPMPKDKNCLSVDNGDLISPKDSLQQFLNNGFHSIGIYGVTGLECQGFNLTFRDDPTEIDFAHALIDFSALSKSQIQRVAGRLRDLAEHRGWLHESN